MSKVYKSKVKKIFICSQTRFSDGSGRFLPTCDSTDHFGFCCADCKTSATVIEIEFDRKYRHSADKNKKVGSALFFTLQCPKCRKSGIRKIYPEKIDVTEYDQ